MSAPSAFDARLDWAASADASIPVRFLAAARTEPEAVAIETRGVVTTYGELAERARRLAEGILAAGVEPGARVAIALREPETNVAAILGTLMAGCAYVPLDLCSSPAEHVERVLEDAAPELVLCDGDGPELRHRVPVASVADLERARPLAIEAVANDPDAPVSVLYTSGSTGRPKGVVQNHRNVIFHVRALSDRFEIAPHDKHSLVAPFTFDASTTDLYCALLNGATLVPIDLRRDGLAHLGTRLAEHGVTLFHATPTIFRRLASLLDEDGGGLPQLRLVLLGGEVVTDDDFRLFCRCFDDDCLFVNGYGATETSGFVALYPMTKRDASPGPLIPIGWPPAGVKLVLRARERPDVEIEAGEVSVVSRHVALGYVHDARGGGAFEGDSRQSGERTYWTGDIGRRLPDGAVLLTGRRDRQAKVRGYRVELGEIDAALASAPDVHQGTAVVRDGDAVRAAELIAFVEPVPGVRIDPRDVRGHLRRVLPEYMVPAHVEVVERLPSTATGKVDGAALAAGVADRRHGAVLPACLEPTARLVGEIWANLLEADAIGLDDNFFDLGGDSLLLTQVHKRLERTLGAELSAAQLFEHPTVRLLAAFLDGVSGEATVLRDVDTRMARRRQARALRVASRGESE